jgi:hypothetical protein
VTFWEKHRQAILSGVLVLFVFVVTWLAFLRRSHARAEDLSADIADVYGKLEPHYPEIKDREKIHLPLLADVELDCGRRRNNYEKQLEELTGRLRFPFTSDKVPEDERPGIFVIKEVDRVGKNVYHYKAHSRKTSLGEGWLDFLPRIEAAKVTRQQAEESLRRLALADRVTRLAIDAGVRWVLRVKPEAVTREAARVSRDSAKFYRRLNSKDVPTEHVNRFIVNYPVNIEVIGPLDSIMRFFHSMRGERHFLVIRSFNILSREEERVSADTRELMERGDVLVTISAACMDFDESKSGDGTGKTAPEIVLPEDGYNPPEGPLGF